MEKETIYEMKSLDMKLGDLDKKRKQTIIQIIAYSCLLALGITALIIGIIKKDTYFCIVYPIFNIFAISLIVICSIQLRDINKQIKAVCKAIADLISKEAEKAFEKMFEDITNSFKEIKPNKPCSVVNPKSFVPEEEKAKEEKKEPKKAPAKKKTTTKKTTKKTK